MQHIAISRLLPSPARYRTPAVVGSLLLHGTLVLALLTPPAHHKQAVQLISVEIVPPQIVTEPESPVVAEPPSTSTLLAEQNRRAERETIRRGESPMPPAAPPQPQTAPQPPAVPRLLSPREAPQLKLSEQEIAVISSSDAPAPAAASQRKSSPSSNQAKSAVVPFSRPAGSGASLFGSPDLLPNLPDGDITFLNTKASQHAVFVRRVALQVFSEIKRLGWEQLSPAEIQSIAESVEIHAELTSQGALARVWLVTPSGSSSFDRTIESAVRYGARDPNPPAAAARRDGSFEFIFRSRCWTQLGISRRGGPFERRWLVLETGLG